MSRVRVESGKCVGHGQCAMMAPEVFDLDADGYVQVVVEELGEQQALDARDAALACPEQAIAVVD
ncbi:ferredoxin [Nocardioides humi]|uniref:Ferredoxin n=1 Tax=Nocardioides humi TaxID=449461 RepID=A0ABN2AHA7_9ACTN|nr:ferredoxin [Nocardioides humi]